jgi:hypothetical protein
MADSVAVVHAPPQGTATVWAYTSNWGYFGRYPVRTSVHMRALFIDMII